MPPSHPAPTLHRTDRRSAGISWAWSSPKRSAFMKRSSRRIVPARRSLQASRHAWTKRQRMVKEKAKARGPATARDMAKATARAPPRPGPRMAEARVVGTSPLLLRANHGPRAGRPQVCVNMNTATRTATRHLQCKGNGRSTSATMDETADAGTLEALAASPTAHALAANVAATTIMVSHVTKNPIHYHGMP